MRGRGCHIGIVGATGAVGREMLACLERLFPEASGVRLFASSRSAGTEFNSVFGRLVVEDLSCADFSGLDLSLFSAGKAVSLEYADKFLSLGCSVIDNSSAFRGSSGVLLCVPEVNGDLIDGRVQIIANPNCSTIQLVAVLSVLERSAGLERVQVATYQSCSGAGEGGVRALLSETEATLRGSRPAASSVHARCIAFDTVPQIGSFDSDGYSEEEMKMITETRKILGLPDLGVSATCVRVPVFRGHSEVVHVKTRKALSRADAISVLSGFAGITVCDLSGCDHYPTPYSCSGSDDIFVGRIREDKAEAGSLILWIVSDNLLKGAALNAVQIAAKYWQRYSERSVS